MATQHSSVFVEAQSFINLAPDVVHVLGAKRSALYDLARQRLFSIDADGTTILQSLLNGDGLEEVARVHADCRSFVHHLQSKDLVLVEGASIDHNMHLRAAPVVAPMFGIAWIELGNRCNHGCGHCYADSGPSVSNSRADLVVLRKALDELISLDTHTIKFIGGEPLAYGAELRELLSYARSSSKTVSLAVHTNGTLLTPEWADLFERIRVHVDVTLYAATARVHDAVTKKPGSFLQTLRGLDLLASRRLTVGINVVVVPENEDLLDETKQFCAAMFPGFSFGFDYVRPSGRGGDAYSHLKFSQLNRYQEHDRGFRGIDRDLYLSRQRFNPCLGDKIAIDASGQVFPCMMTRVTTGAVDSQSIRQIVESPEFKAFRNLSLDQVETCRDCEYRYACTDCRPIAIGVTGNRLSKPPECRYDPYSGTSQSSHSSRVIGWLKPVN